MDRIWPRMWTGLAMAALGVNINERPPGSVFTVGRRSISDSRRRGSHLMKPLFLAIKTFSVPGSKTKAIVNAIFILA